MPTDTRQKRRWIPPEEKTAILAILATLGLIIMFLSQSAARATDEAAAKDLFMVCNTLDHVAPQLRTEHHIAVACAHPEWFAQYRDADRAGRLGGP